MSRWVIAVIVVAGALACGDRAPAAEEPLIPPLSAIRAERPRVLLRAGETKSGVSLERLRNMPMDAEANAILARLAKSNDAASLAIVWRLTGDASAAERAVRRLREYRFPGKVDTFHVYFRLSEAGLAYDWLHGSPAFTDDVRREVRANHLPLAREALRVSDDHVFHNYVWMSAGGAALWSLATAGDDAESDAIFEKVRSRFNERLFPAMRYLDGHAAEPMGYWSLYCFTPCVWTVLATQSAFDVDVVGRIRREQGDWLDRQVLGVIHSTLPDMRYVPFGDLQGGANGGVTMDMAGVIDAAAWALDSPEARQFGSWLKERRGPARYRGETGVFHFLYGRDRRDAPTRWPPLSFLAGNERGGHFLARGGWDANATVVGFRCADHYGDHNHWDQGGFLIYRNGLLAVDPPVYRQTRGPQQATEYHNTLLIGGKGQRPVRGQSFATLAAFERNLHTGKRLETGNILWSTEQQSWAAVAGEYAPAYDVPELASCVRQLLFVRPGTVVVVDRLTARDGSEVPAVRWLLQLPQEPEVKDGEVVVKNAKSSLRCRQLWPKRPADVAVDPTPVNTRRLSLTYQGGREVVLAHVLEVGDGAADVEGSAASARVVGRGVEVTLGRDTFLFAADGKRQVERVGN